jgi:hypothetical protein
MSPVDRRANKSEVRIRFKDFVLQQLPDTRYLARVVLAWHLGDEFVGTAEGENSPQGQLRAAAEATVQALEAAAHGQVGLTVLSVNALETFETVLVVVSLSSHVDHRSERLVGSCLIKERPARGAALSVLNATNRLLSIYLH